MRARICLLLSAGSPARNGSDAAIARHDAELARVEKARLEEALAHVAARLHATEHDRHPISIDDTGAEALMPLGLSRRESEVLLWLARGKTNAEIATILGCGAETVKTHLKRVFQRLDVTNRAAAITQAVSFVARPKRR